MGTDLFFVVHGYLFPKGICLRCNLSGNRRKMSVRQIVERYLFRRQRLQRMVKFERNNIYAWCYASLILSQNTRFRKGGQCQTTVRIGKSLLLRHNIDDYFKVSDAFDNLALSLSDVIVACTVDKTRRIPFRRVT